MDSPGSLFQERFDVYPLTTALLISSAALLRQQERTSRRSAILFFLIRMPGITAEMTFLNKSAVLTADKRILAYPHVDSVW